MFDGWKLHLLKLVITWRSTLLERERASLDRNLHAGSSNRELFGGVSGICPTASRRYSIPCFSS